MAFGNTAIFEQDVLAVADTSQLARNVVQWAAGGKPAPRVGVFRIDGRAAELRRIGLNARDIQLAECNTVDVILTLARLLEASDVDPLLGYVSAGGGLIAGTVGFNAEARLPLQDFPTAFPANRVFASAGIVWGRSNLSHTAAAGFAVTPPPELSHVRRALAAFEAREAGRQFLRAGEMSQISTTLMRALADAPYTDTTFLAGLGRALEPFRARAIPSAAMPIMRDDIPWRL